MILSPLKNSNDILFVSISLLSIRFLNLIISRFGLENSSSLLVWFLKSFFIYIVGVKIFPNKNTKCNFLKVLTIVGLAHSPLIFNFLIFNDSLFYGILLTYVWYVSALVVGINEILNYKNKLKSFLVSFIAPIVISLSLMILYLKISI